MSKKKRVIVIIVASLVFIAALILTLYPLISNYVNNKYQSEVQSAYQLEIAKIDTSAIDDAKTAAMAYNESLLPVRYSKEALETAEANYFDLLNLSSSGIMGYIEIPILDLYLPIYHGTSEEVLQEGIGHLQGSSLPIGGQGCHCVLTGHSGIAGKELFSDLDQLEEGDLFQLHVLDETLYYEVDKISRVLPHETDELNGIMGRDLCTLVTCTPYGVNTHRLLVRGTRITPEQAEELEETPEEREIESTWKKQYNSGLLIGICAIAVFWTIMIIVLFVKKKKRKEEEQKQQEESHREKEK